jgi:protein subunit release factor A
MSEIPHEELKLELWPPRQKGGQHVGGGPNGVKVTHLPTGIEATVDCARSQHINKLLAMEMVLAAITHPRMPEYLPTPPSSLPEG